MFQAGFACENSIHAIALHTAYTSKIRFESFASDIYALVERQIKSILMLLHWFSIHVRFIVLVRPVFTWHEQDGSQWTQQVKQQL